MQIHSTSVIYYSPISARYSLSANFHTKLIRLHKLNICFAVFVMSCSVELQGKIPMNEILWTVYGFSVLSNS